MSRESLMAASRMCECHHVDEWHKKFLPPGTEFGSGFGECKGYTSSGNPTTGYRPCPCREFRPWNGPWDAKTGEPIKPITLSTAEQGPKT